MAATTAAAAALAALVAAAERPAPFTLSPRDGRGLRLVPASERLSQAQLALSMEQYLLAATIPVSLVETLQQQAATVPPAKATGARAQRHVAAWARGCCYLQAGNARQALQDARAALAFCAAGTPSGAPPKWFPALLLAGQAYAALEEWSQAVVHLAQARASALDAGAASAASAQLSVAVRQLPADQLLAWSARGLPGLMQALQDEAEMRLPEALRPRPKWYYYNTWTTQRIHLALLELQLAASQQGLLRSAGAGSSSTSSSRGRLLLDLLAGDTDEAPAVAAAAAAAGFGGTPTDMHAATAVDGDEAAVGVAAARDSPPEAGAAMGHLPLLPLKQPQQQQHQRSLQLPQPVLAKLLAMDAGDLDLMIQHPVALQAQAYELLDVLQASGPEALEGYTLQQLSWQEVQALTGPGTVGLPLGYSAAGGHTLPPPPPPVQLLPASAAPLADGQALTVAGEGAADTTVVAVADSHVEVSTGFRRPGWTRAQYIAAAAAGAVGAGAEQPRS